MQRNLHEFVVDGKKSRNRTCEKGFLIRVRAIKSESRDEVL